jgi:signal recognition particle GTPase
VIFCGSGGPILLIYKTAVLQADFSKGLMLTSVSRFVLVYDANRQVKRALLDADVNLKVVNSLLEAVKEKALGKYTPAMFTSVL